MTELTNGAKNNCVRRSAESGSGNYQTLSNIARASSAHEAPKNLARNAASVMPSTNSALSKPSASQTASLAPPLSAKTFLYASTTAGSTPPPVFVSACFRCPARSARASAVGGAAAIRWLTYVAADVGAGLLDQTGP